MAPIILFVPGLWEGPTVFTKVSYLLQAKNFNTLTVTLPSTGTSSPGNPSIHDDEAAIRTVVQERVEEGKEVLMVLHCAGGFLGSAAIEGLTAKSRKEQGKNGGVIGIVFLSAGIAEVGYQQTDRPFMEFDVSCFSLASHDPNTSLRLNDQWHLQRA